MKSGGHDYTRALAKTSPSGKNIHSLVVGVIGNSYVYRRYRRLSHEGFHTDKLRRDVRSCGQRETMMTNFPLRSRIVCNVKFPEEFPGNIKGRFIGVYTCLTYQRHAALVAGD